eukprot:300492-Pleurochrysis_carterae.AAC.5
MINELGYQHHIDLTNEYKCLHEHCKTLSFSHSHLNIDDAARGRRRSYLAPPPAIYGSIAHIGEVRPV